MVTALLKEPHSTELQSHPKKREWHAELCLELEERRSNSGSDIENRTVLARQRHFGPLRIQRAFYPEGNTCHLYLLHPPGGLVEGDCLSIQGTLRNNAHGLVTTPSAGKCYHSLNANNPQIQTVQFHLDESSTLEWLPQENIFFRGSHSIVNTEFHIEESSQLLGWDIACLGRPASNELFDSGTIDQTVKIIRNSLPIFIERNRIDGQRPMMQSHYGFQCCTVTGLFFCTVGKEFDIKRVKEYWQEHWPGKAEALCSITYMDEILVARYLGHSSEECRTLFTDLWRTIRPSWIGKPASMPRIWNT